MRKSDTIREVPHQNQRTLGLTAVSLILAVVVPLGPFAGAEPSETSAGEPSAIANWASAPYWLPPAREREDSSVEPGVSRVERTLASEVLAVSGAALPFFAINPCRLADTRGFGFSGSFGPPSMPGSSPRNFPISGQCGIPSAAQAVSFNFTVTNTQGPGFLLVYPQGGSQPNVSTLNYVAGQTLANAAIVALGSGGITVIPGVSGFDVLIDVNGYYAPSGIVSSLNSLTGDVSLTAGSNITITPSGNSLALAAPLTNLNAGNVTSGVLGLSFGGTGSTNATGARFNLGAASSGSNSDITALLGLSTPLSISQGGTGSNSPFQTAFQARVTGACVAGSFVASVGANGSVGCAAPTVLDPRPGFTRTAIDSAGYVGSNNSITIGTDGLGLISYYDETNGHLKVAHCVNAACTSATAATLDASATVGFGTSITIAPDGLGLISYLSLAGDVNVAHCADLTCASATAATIDNVSSVANTSIAIGTDGLALVSYYRPSGGLKVAHCNDAACTTAAVATIDGAAALSGNSIVIGADGLGLVSYWSQTGNVLKVAHCSNPTCSIATPATLAVSAGPSSITVGSDGLGLISYHDQANGDLKIAHCTSVTCSTATVSMLDSYGDVGGFNAITIGSDGLGLISYRDDANGGLKVAHCSNPTCSSASVVTVESGVSTQTSVTVGSDGMPLISYWDSTNRDLKVAHCGNLFCAPFVRRR